MKKQFPTDYVLLVFISHTDYFHIIGCRICQVVVFIFFSCCNWNCVIIIRFFLYNLNCEYFRKFHLQNIL